MNSAMNGFLSFNNLALVIYIIHDYKTIEIMPIVLDLMLI